MTLEWIRIKGGTCLFGDKARPVAIADLLCTRTPVTYANLGGPADSAIPVTGVNHDEASAHARRLDARLPSSTEWEWIASGPTRRRYPWGETEWTSSLAALRPADLRQPVAVGSYPAGATPDGVLDLAGNVWEWTRSVTLGRGAVIRGGSYASPPLYAQCTFLNAAPAELRSAGIGFRLVRPA